MAHQSLSHAQELIWIGQKLNPKAPLYNMVMTFTIHSKIDMKRFATAFDLLVAQSESLRLVFEDSEAGVQQRLLKTINYKLDLIDATENGFDIETWAVNSGQKLFNLTETTFDAALLKHSDEKFTWYLNQHHIATDASSFKALFTHLGELYKGLENPSEPLPSFLSHLKSKQALQANSKAEDIVTTEKGHIKEEAKPFGNTVHKHSSGESTRVELPLSKMHLEKLDALLETDAYRMMSKNMALLNFFYGLFSVLLNKITGKHMAIGLPTHNRQSQKEKQTPGLFMEVVTTNPSEIDSASFDSLYDKNKEVILSYLFASQDSPSNNPADQKINALLNFITAQFGDFNGAPCTTKWLHNGYHDAEHWIRFHVEHFNAGDLRLRLDLNKTVFSKQQQEFVVEAFSRLIEQAIMNGMSAINDWQIITPSQSLIIQKNTQLRQNAPLENKPVLSAFLENVEKNPAAIAIKSGREQLSYQQLNADANQLANYLHQKGLQAKQRVGVLVEPSILFVKTILALLKCNAVFVPIDAAYPKKRIEYLLQKSKATLLLTTTKHLDKVEGLSVELVNVSKEKKAIENCDNQFTHQLAKPSDLIYLLFTSGSTGQPKGVQITNYNLANYLGWAKHLYLLPGQEQISAAFFTSVGFDLTYTSLFLPLITGGAVHPQSDFEVDPIGTLKTIFSDADINFVKLTPAHAQVLSGIELPNRTTKTIILGGEQLTTSIANQLKLQLNEGSEIYNEYGPTEATIGCIIYQIKGSEKSANIPIGKVSTGMQALLLDENQNEVPAGVVGELFLAGSQVALGYADEPEQTLSKFIKIPKQGDAVFYKTGDLARINTDWNIEFLGRSDSQLKIGSRRIEREEIEHVLNAHPQIKTSVVLAKSSDLTSANLQHELDYCANCGLPNNYPYIHFNSDGLCEICEKYEAYSGQADAYFKTKEELFDLLGSTNNEQFDCMVLLSGGKDSSFALAKLAEQNLRILAFTLDNGFLSKEAMENIDRVVAHLGVKHVWARTPAMNEIFVDSLNRYANVCDGCFKTIYTLATQMALEKKIPYIVTGLSRGQFFETRLTEELFLKETVDVAAIDASILEARKAYHKVDDAVKRLITTPSLLQESTFEEVKFIDFYRYYDVTYNEMMDFLTNGLPWLKPKDTGRSTNCLINELGIHVHKSKRGYHNYALPYSWDVRLGHKTRAQAIEEFCDHFEDAQIKQMAAEIGFDGFASKEQHLIAFYTAKGQLSEVKLRDYLAEYLPSYMIPSYFKELSQMPLTNHGKIDFDQLAQSTQEDKSNRSKYVAPRNDIEDYLAKLWSTFLQLETVSVLDNFISLGGHSIVAIRILARLESDLNLKIPVTQVFENPTVAQLAAYLEKKMEAGLAE